MLLSISIFIFHIAFAPFAANTIVKSTTSDDTRENFDKQLISDLGNGKRSLLALGMSKARFILLIGNSEREINPSSLYVYEPPLHAFNSESSPPYLKLSNGGSLAEKYPALYGALQGATVRNRTVVITDSSSGYLLFAFDTNGTTAPLLYSINEAKMIESFRGAASLQTMLNQQYQVFTMLSSSSPMNFYSIKKYYYREKHVGPDPDGKPITYCIFELGSWSFNDSTMVPTQRGLQLNRIYFESSICKDDSDNTVTVSKKCKYPSQCLHWDIMAAFANEKRIYMLGPAMVYAVENVFASSNVDKKKLSVVSFKLKDFLVSETPLRTTAAPPPPSLIFMGVIALLLLISVSAVTFWLCTRKFVLAAPDDPSGTMPPTKVAVKQSTNTQAGTSTQFQRKTNPNFKSQKSKKRSTSRKTKKKEKKSKSNKSGKSRSKRK